MLILPRVCQLLWRLEEPKGNIGFAMPLQDASGGGLMDADPPTQLSCPEVGLQTLELKHKQPICEALITGAGSHGVSCKGNNVDEWLQQAQRMDICISTVHC